MAGGGRLAAFRRTALALAATAAALAATTAAPVPAAARQDASSPAGDRTFSSSANARADVVAIAPKSGSLAFAITAGTAAAGVVGDLAESLAQSADFGLIGSSLTAEQCDGDDPVLSPDQLPQPTMADDRNGDSSHESVETAVLPPVLGAGREQASATTQPAARSSVIAGDLDLAPALRVGGGTSVAEAELIAGVAREARSSVVLDLDIAGLVRMTGARWVARHRTGDTEVAEGSFTLEALEVLGLPVPTDDLETLTAIVNDVLAPVGLRLELPRLERVTEPVDLVRVSPLRIVLEDSPVLESGLGPVLDLTRQARGELFDALVAVTCRAANVLLVGEIGLGTVSGTGSMVVDLGGVEARTGQVEIEDAFGRVPASPAALAEIPTGVAAGTGAVAAPAAPGAAPAAAVTAPALAAVDLVRVCESTHPERVTSCSRGSATTVGLVGVGLTAAVALLDWRRRRAARVSTPVPA